MDTDDVEKEYNEVSRMLHAAMMNPEDTAQRFRAHIAEALPGPAGDALTDALMNKIQGSAVDLPPEHGPATAFGVVPGTSDRQKREFLRRHKARFDPLSAVESGRQDLIQEAEKYNPETLHEIKKRVIDRIHEPGKKVPYLTKRKVLGILGIAGTPTQDPLLGAQLQQILQIKKQASSQAGQMGSARQMNANMKNDSATLTRAQKILNTTGE